MKSYTNIAMPRISYFVLPDGKMVDVYLRKELPSEVGADGEEVFVYDEVNFRISSDITQQQIEENFELLFNDPNALDERELPLEVKNRADIDYLAAMTGVEL